MKGRQCPSTGLERLQGLKGHEKSVTLPTEYKSKVFALQ
jgi:hypothetical protein